MKRFLLLFIDGIGLGRATGDNPFAGTTLPGFSLFSGGQEWTADAETFRSDRTSFQAVDACLGVPGLPQSGTGQATLFTGVNCASVAGRHFGPFPHSTSLPIIAGRNIFVEVSRLGGRASFVNAYPPEFFEYVRTRNRWSVTTRCCLDAGLRIRTLDDLLEGNALAADITGVRLQKHSEGCIPPVTEERAAQILASITSRHSFTAFEYFITDKVGHARAHEEAAECLISIDRLLTELAVLAVEHGFTVIVTSDHGNMEDLSVRTHTLNAVPLAAYGPDAGVFHGSTSIMDVVLSCLKALTG